ncbi:MAG TPA: pyridoxamine 5'-phosphate oxidase family protein [Thermomicrobiales bacterium]|nr:pyridoxamine 5'-phosphate oxidase family protein [Thermomicrobiales bacterium]
MTSREPTTELDSRFSSESSSATPWQEARAILDQAEIYWLTTVRPDGRPHVTPLIAVWVEDALYFCTGADERKARNLRQNAHVVVTTGCNALEEGLDLVIEGDAVKVTDRPTLQRVTEGFASKYDDPFRFDVVDGAIQGETGNVALVYKLSPATAFGFGKGDTFSQTRWRF